VKAAFDIKKLRLAVIIGLPVLLAVFLALSFAAEKYVPTDSDSGEAISVGAFEGGYDAIINELAEKQASAQSGTTETVTSNPYQINFSLDASGVYFFNTEQSLAIAASQTAEIFYTTDGTPPTRETGTPYTTPIILTCGANTIAYNFSVIAYFNNATTTTTAFRTYFVGKNAAEKYDTLVLSLTSDPKGLTSRKTGIFYDNNIWNTGRDWERETNVACYNSDGSLLFSQNAGLRIFGAYSRSMSLKPMRLIARKDYDIQNRFEYNIFGNLYATDGTKVETFQQLVFRNAGNDFGTAFMRDEVVQTLMAQQGFIFTESVRPCLIYVNGKLYGFYWIHEPYKESYFKQHFGNYNYKGSFVVLDGAERAKSDFDQDYADLNPLADYRKMYAYSKKDLTDDAVYAELCSRLDVDSYLQMNASMAYVDNGDWPQNNNRAFKYFPADGENFSDVYGMDGKWYYVPHDSDWAFFNDAATNTLDRNNSKKEIQYSPLFVALMKRDDCRRTFVTYMLDMMNGAFTPENTKNTVQSIIDAIRNSVQIMQNESKYAPADSDNASFERRAPRVIEYLKVRGSYMSQYLKDKYNLGGFYKLSLSLPDGGAAFVNTLYVDADYSGTYYENYTTILKAVVPPGKIFKCWVVGGTEYTTPELVIDASFVRQAKVNVSMELTDPETPALSLYEVSSKGDSDYIILVNNTNKVISTLGYALTDDAANPTKYLMPVMHIEPGAKIKIFCKNTASAQVLRSMVTSFALKDGETVTLSRKDADSGIVSTLDSVTLPKVKDTNIYRRNLTTGDFFEVSPDTIGTGTLNYNKFNIK
jgi:CotH protein.